VRDASATQYTTATPTCTACLHAGTGALPRTGLDVAPLLIAGVLLIVIAMGIKAHV
jgi:hypothetical protein